MKNLLSLFLIRSACLQIHAQGIHFIQEDITIGQSEACVPFYSVSGVVNNTGSLQTIVWERLENNMPCDWSNSVCDINLCYAPTIDSHSFILSDGDTMYLSVNFYPQNQEAEGSVVMQAFVQDDPAIADTLTFIGISTSCENSEPCITSTSQYILEELSVFPNPFNNELFIENLSASANVSIFDLQGRLRFSAKGLHNGTLNVEQIDRGVYLLQVCDRNIFYREIIIKE
jgi:hypothetical protein